MIAIVTASVQFQETMNYELHEKLGFWRRAWHGGQAAQNRGQRSLWYYRHTISKVLCQSVRINNEWPGKSISIDTIKGHYDSSFERNLSPGPSRRSAAEQLRRRIAGDSSESLIVPRCKYNFSSAPTFICLQTDASCANHLCPYRRDFTSPT